MVTAVGGRESLGLLRRDGGVALDQAGEDTTQRLDTQRQRGHVEQQDVFHITLKHAGLDGGTHGHHFVRVHTLVRILAEEALHGFLHLGHAGHAADQNNVVDLRSRQAGILERFLAGLEGALDEVFDQGFQLGTGQLDVQVFGTRSIGGDEGQVHFIGRGRGEFLLGLFGFFLQALESQLVGLQVDAVFLFELVGKIFDDTHVEVFTAQEGVTIGGLHLEHAVTDLQDRDVERATAQVEHGDGPVFALVQAIGQGGCGRLVDDAQDFQAGDLAGILGGLALGVIEIGRNRDHGLFDLLAEIAFRGFLHLLQRESRDFGRCVLLVAALDPSVIVFRRHDRIGHHVDVLLDRRVVHRAADQALDGKKGVVRVGDGLAFRRLADEALAILGEGDDGRGGPGAFGILDDLCLAVLHDSHTGVGRTQVDADDLAH